MLFDLHGSGICPRPCPCRPRSGTPLGTASWTRVRLKPMKTRGLRDRRRALPEATPRRPSASTGRRFKNRRSAPGRDRHSTAPRAGRLSSISLATARVGIIGAASAAPWPSVQGFASFEHLDVLGNACGSRSRPFEIGHAEGHREPVLRRLGREGFRDLRVRVQGFLSSTGRSPSRCRYALSHRPSAFARSISCWPWGRIDLLDQPSHVTDVDLRPHASRSSWREGLQVVVGVEGLRLPSIHPKHSATSSASAYVIPGWVDASSAAAVGPRWVGVRVQPGFPVRDRVHVQLGLVHTVGHDGRIAPVPRASQNRRPTRQTMVNDQSVEAIRPLIAAGRLTACQRDQRARSFVPVATERWLAF